MEVKLEKKVGTKKCQTARTEEASQFQIMCMNTVDPAYG